MDGRARTFLLLQVLFCFIVLASTEETKQNCSQVECPGPLTYYKDIGCTPVYKKEGDCCAYKYNCDHLDARSPNKCYFKNSSYEIGEFVSREDIKVCDVTCVCAANRNSTQLWCFRSNYESSFQIGGACYLKRYVLECGPGTVTCPGSDSEIPRCIVDGHTYMAGQVFVPKNGPRKICICQEGYTGDNIEPFCVTVNINCNPDLYFNEDIASKHAPMFSKKKNFPEDCMFGWRRQMANDTVIPNPNKSASPGENHSDENEDLTCKFGNLTMNVGDQLSPATIFESHIVKCTCEVPPTPTCTTDVNIY